MLQQSLLFKIHARRFLLLSALIVALIGGLGVLWHPLWWLFVIVGPVVLIGLWDIFFATNTILRNYPFLGHFRFMFMHVSPEIHQYFVENNTEGTPFSKIQRETVYKRAEARLQTHPFGTEQDVYADQYQWVQHSIYPRPVMEAPPRVRVGGPDCKLPYHASLLNVSAMSYGSLSAAAVRALNIGACEGGFYHNTGEGGLSPYHEVAGADVVWQIGSGYFGCRDKNGDFDSAQFEATATKPNVKMIELKLSQGAKPGHGGVLPGCKITPEIARIRGVEPHKTVTSPSYHKTFSDARGLLDFITRLRELSGGKPVGFKLSIGDEQEFVEICRAMLVSGIRPDFITVDGGEGGTGAAPLEFSDSMGMPLEEALVLVVDTLIGLGLKGDIRVIASGKVITAFDMLRAIAIGADLCNSARGMMFALGCIQALRCDTDECPTGITTHKPGLTRGLIVPLKAKRVANFHRETVRAALEIVAAAGLDGLDQLQRRHIRRRLIDKGIHTLEQIYPTVKPGSGLATA